MMTTEQEQNLPRTVDETLTRIDASWNELQDFLNSLSEPQITERRDASGWSIKDHLSHLRDWQQSLLALLEGRDRLAAMGIDPSMGFDVEKINAKLYHVNKGRPLTEVRSALEESHRALVATIAKLSDEDIYKPYADYQPSSPDRKDPVIRWIIGDTYEHYDEHGGWARELIAS
jgi:hypothetical protein